MVSKGPHALEIVETAHFRTEQVDDNIACVDQDPISSRKAFNPDMSEAALLDTFSKLLRHGGNLPGRATGSDYHVICHGALALKRDRHNFLCLIIVKRAQYQFQNGPGRNGQRSGCRTGGDTGINRQGLYTGHGCVDGLHG